MMLLHLLLLIMLLLLMVELPFRGQSLRFLMLLLLEFPLLLLPLLVQFGSVGNGGAETCPAMMAGESGIDSVFVI